MSTPTAAHGALPEAGEREAFEATIGKGRALILDAQGDYASPWVQNDWEIWQARAALPPASPAPADPLALAILAGMTYAELREKALYLMDLNANQARTIDALQLAATPAQQTQSDAVAGAVDFERAAWMLDCYVEHIRKNVLSADIEMHPYLPEMEGMAEDLRAAATPPQQATPSDPWREAVLDALANSGLDAPIGEAPAAILKRVIDCALTFNADMEAALAPAASIKPDVQGEAS
jgi:hypothetical protein